MLNLKNPACTLQSFWPATSRELGSQMCPVSAAIGNTAPGVIAQLVILSVLSSRSTAPPHWHLFMSRKKNNIQDLFFSFPRLSHLFLPQKKWVTSLCVWCGNSICLVGREIISESVLSQDKHWMFPSTSSILALTLDPEPLSLPGRKQNKTAKSLGLPSNFSGGRDVMKIKPRNRRRGRGGERGQRKPGSPGRWAHLCARTDPTSLTCHFPGKGGESLRNGVWGSIYVVRFPRDFFQFPWTENPQIQTHRQCSHLNKRLQRVRCLLVSGVFQRAARSCLISDQMVCLNLASFLSFRLHGHQC